MKKLIFLALLGLPLLPASADALSVCRAVSTCEAAYASCAANRAAGRNKKNCEGLAATCRATGIWNGGQGSTCRMPGR
jgi:hypothetical protein